MLEAIHHYSIYFFSIFIPGLTRTWEGAKSEFRSNFSLNWENVFTDIIWERVYSKFLNTWLLYLAMMWVLNLNRAEIILFDDKLISTVPWFSTIFGYLLILCFSTMATLAILPFMLANTADRLKLSYNRILLISFPVVSAVLFWLNWIHVKNHENGYTVYALFVVSLIGCIGCFLYFCLVITRKVDPYVDRKLFDNFRYVSTLLQKRIHSQTQQPLYSTHLHYAIHPVFESVASLLPQVIQNRLRYCPSDAFIVHGLEKLDPTHKPPQERDIFTFFRTFDLPAVLRDVKKHTPQLMLFGSVLGVGMVGIMLGYTLQYCYIHTTWSDLVDWYEDMTAGIEAYLTSVVTLYVDISVHIYIIYICIVCVLCCVDICHQ
jgi:hypothetical protein